MATEQIAVRVPVVDLAVVDELVDRGVYESRAAVVRAGIAAVIELERRRRDDRRIVAGYERLPPSDAERSAAVASMREAIAEEPW